MNIQRGSVDAGICAITGNGYINDRLWRARWLIISSVLGSEETRLVDRERN